MVAASPAADENSGIWKYTAMCRCLTRGAEFDKTTESGMFDGARPSGERLDEKRRVPDIVYPDMPGEALALASVAPGCRPDACKFLALLKDMSGDPTKFVSRETIDGLQSFKRRFADFKKMLNPDFDRDRWDRGRNDDLDLDFAYRVNGDNLEVLCSRIYVGIDAVNGVVGFSESDFVVEHTRDVLTNTTIRDLADGSLWQQVKELEDNVVQVELVNALDDEELGAICVMFYACPDGSRDYPFVSLPSVGKGKFRRDYFKQHLTFTPVPCRSTPAFRLQNAFSIPMPEAIRSSLQHMPHAMRNRVMGPVCSLFPEHFSNFLSSNVDLLKDRELTSVHSPFYALCRARLERRSDAERKEAWSEVSQSLPDNWADGC
eukprot:gnl/TRDRNA2_/TRDRNA2_91667_c0_seq1.p1 gnl/TRDRNA2_/TRDRNA2_91667_c0~~gnl/TRDRNA2_/TRDRNA2_91667_c0_seq1.p1  ORF type:complete len:375 (+),score=61.98 gnl/TRDRNA2_/TRDRNA2_91667_c0_seq1:80-1204(+)